MDGGKGSTETGQGATDLGLFKVRSLGLPRATRGPGGGCEASGGGTAAALAFLDSFFPRDFSDFLSDFREVDGLAASSSPSPDLDVAAALAGMGGQWRVDG